LKLSDSRLEGRKPWYLYLDISDDSLSLVVVFADERLAIAEINHPLRQAWLRAVYAADRYAPAVDDRRRVDFLRSTRHCHLAMRHLCGNDRHVPT
jgi:hypothetical protein